MKILYITTQFPFPLDNGGKKGAFNGISVVSRENDVTVLSFPEQPKYIDEGLQYFREVFPNVVFERPILHSVHIRKKPLKLARVMINDYVRNMPYVTVKFENSKMYKLIDKKFKYQEWDLVFIDYLNMQIYGEYIKKKHAGNFKCMILKDHNLEYEIVRQASDKERGIKKAILEAEWKRTLEYEKKAISAADLVYSVCEENTNFMKKYNPSAHTMLPTYESKKLMHKTLGTGILFMGNLSWGANMDGLIWFVDEVLPRVNKIIPDVRLTVVGSGPAENPFLNNQNVIYKGYVKDISNIYDDQTVFIVPLFVGSGIRIKILDAFNNGIAVVSTKLGCETIGASDGKELFIRDDAEGFSEAVISLLVDSDLRDRMEFDASKFLECKFSLKARQDEFKNDVGKIMELNMR